MPMSLINIRSPLGALGAILAALELIAGGSLFALGASPGLQSILVITMAAVLALVTLVIIGIVVGFAIRNPGLLFDPASFSESVQHRIYGGGDQINWERPGADRRNVVSVGRPAFKVQGGLEE